MTFGSWNKNLNKAGDIMSGIGGIGSMLTGIIGGIGEAVGGKAGNTMQKIGQWGNVAGAGLGALGQGLGQIGSNFGLKSSKPIQLPLITFIFN